MLGPHRGAARARDPGDRQRRTSSVKRYCTFLLLIVVSSLGADPPKAPDAQDDLKTLQGVWTINAVESDGVKVKPDDAKWVLEDNKYTTKVGTQVQEGTVKIDPKKDQKWIELMVTSGKDKGLTYRGIYKFVDGELLWCFPKDTKTERPKEFSGNAGNGQTLTDLKRKKD
jgi:uncharacterized protein (TIGR03067 family)